MTRSVEQGSAGMKLEEIIASVFHMSWCIRTEHKPDARCSGCLLQAKLTAYAAQEKQRRERLEKLAGEMRLYGKQVFNKCDDVREGVCNLFADKLAALLEG